jgi:hypothetical protein
MRELRPSCENCNKPLPPNCVRARICSYECTFCADCVDHVLANVCPNCGGGFEPRPVRPASSWKGDNYLGKGPCQYQGQAPPGGSQAHAQFAAAIRELPPERR